MGRVVGVRVLADPFVVAPPGGTSIRTRLCVTDIEHDLLVEVGDLLAGLRNRDLARLLQWNQTPPKDRSKAERRAEAAARKRVLTAESSSRIANSIVRSNNDLWALAWRNLVAHRRTLRNQIKTLTRRCAVEPGLRVNGAKGYRDVFERAMKQQRLIQRHLTLTSVQGRIDRRRPKICVGGADLARLRHNLPDAGLDVEGWRELWDAARRFLTFIGTSGECFGNDTLFIDPATGVVTLNLPAALAHHSNTAGPRRLYRFAQPVVFGHKTRSVEWAARAAERGGIRYRLRFDPDAKHGRGAWYLNASWAIAPTPAPDLGVLRGQATLGVDLNAGWIAAQAVDVCGNPCGAPITIFVPQHGDTARRLGQLRAAVGELLDAAVAAGCASVSVEDLDFADTRDIGRETLGRGKRAKKFRRQIAGIPTSRFKTTIAAMASTRDLAVIAVDPAYTSRWASKYRWRHTLNCSSDHRCSSHHGAAVVIARRGLGLGARRKAYERSIKRCDCPTKPTPPGVGVGGAKTRTAQPAGRGCVSAPLKTRRQPRMGRKTTRRLKGSSRTQRSATPFGATLRAPPVPRHR